MTDLATRIAEWAASAEGRAKLQKTADTVRQMQIVAEQKRLDDMVLLAELGRKHVTI